MVYLGGDNNLAEEMVYALKCMQLVGSDPPNYEVFALYDGGVGPATLRIEKRGEFPPKGVQGSEGFLARAEEHRVAEAEKKVTTAGVELKNAQQNLTDARQKLERAAQALQPAAAVGEVLKSKKEAEALLKIAESKFNKAEAEAASAKGKLPESVTSVQTALTEFVVNTIEKAPADCYMLVLSGHGSGAVGDFLTGKNTGLSIPDFREALTIIQDKLLGRSYQEEDEHGETQSYPYLKDGKIDILGLDSCVMGMAEVAYEVRECVNYLVGAEGFEPNTGWPFDRILNFLRSELSNLRPPTPRAFAKRIVEEYVSYYLSDYTLADVSTHLCALDLDKIESLASGLGRNEGLLNPIKAEVEAYLTNYETQGAIRAAFLEYIKDPTTQRAIHDELQNEDPDLEKKALGAFENPQTQFAIGEVADELSTDLFYEALADPETQSVMEGLGSNDRLSGLLDEILTDPQTQAAIQELGSDDGLSVLLKNALTKVASREDIRQRFEGSDELLEDLKSDETTARLREALGGGKDFWDLLNKTLRASAIQDALAEALEWDEGLSGIIRKALMDSVTHDAIKDVVVLAHWETQGYKFEQHADLWDFCDRLREGCLKTQSIYQRVSDPKTLKIADTCRRVGEACTKVIEIIDGKGGETGLVLGSASCGPAFQHSHGISIFFPWANITDASGFAEVEHYRSLEFANKTQWDEFLIAYHQATQRPLRLGSSPIHPSKLNRRDDLFTARPAEFGTPLSVALGTELTARIADVLGSALCDRIGALIKVRLGTLINARLGTLLNARLGTSLNARLGTSLNARLGTSLNARLGTSLNARIGTSLNARLGTSLNARLGTSLNARLGTSLNARLGTSLNARIGTSLNARLGTSLNARLGTSLNARLGTSLNARFGSGGGGMPKIESMKNPPVVWRESRKQKEPTEANKRGKAAASM
jgi:hypothetical protein